MPDLPVRALTICQPWASLIAQGDKRVENRTWWTDYRGPLVIHAGKSRKYLDTWDGPQPDPMPFGAAIAVADLVACVRFVSVRRGRLPDELRWLADHEFCEGPYCLVLQRVRRFERPIPCPGALGLWDARKVCLQARIPATFDPDESQTQAR